MKQLFTFLFITLVSVYAKAQTTLAAHTAAGSGNAVGFQFHVENTNTYTIRLFRINMQNDVILNPLAHTVNVWYKANATNAAPGTISVANGWTNASTFIHNQKFNALYPVASNMSIDIPAGATYRIWVSCTDIMGLNVVTPGGGVNTFTAAGVNIKTGDSISWWGSPINNVVGSINRLDLLAQFAGEIEFYQLSACTGAPEVGNIKGINASCPNEAKFYYLENYITGNGITYQWQVATSAAGVYTNVAGATNTIMARTMPTVNQYFRCIASCGALKDTTPVFSDTIKLFYLCYCASKPNNITDTKIDSVVISTTRAGSLASLCEDYTDNRLNFTPPKLRAGMTYPIDVINGTCGANFFNASGSIFVDFNKSGVFDPIERLGTGWTNPFTAGSVRATTNLTIPLNPLGLGITGLRVLYYETLTPPATACGAFPAAPSNSWGETEDYLIEIIKDPIDANMISINGLDNGCNMGNTNISFSVSNIGSSAINPLPMCYSINGGTPVCENLATLAIGATSAYTFATQANLAGHGKKTIKIWHNNPLDTNKINDTIFKSIMNFPTPPDPIAKHDTVCNGSPQTILRAPSYDSFMTRWYTDIATTNEITQGNQVVITNPTSNNTRYAKSVYVQSTNVGPTIMSPETTVAGNGQGLTFDVLRNKVKINSVQVKFATSGIGAIEIRTSGGVLLSTKSFIVPTAGIQTIPLAFELPIGTGYRMLLGLNPGLTVARGAHTTGFPYLLPGVISITGSTTANVYNFFFDWNITYDACVSNVVPVNSVYIGTTASPIRTLKKDTFFCEYPDVYIYAQNAGCTYKWHDNTLNKTIKVTNSGLYIVTITNSIGCNIVDSSKIKVNISPIFSLGNDTTVCSSKTVMLKSGFSNKGYNHVWSNNDLNPYTPIVTQGTYSCYVYNTNTNCGYSDTIKVNFKPSPNAFLGRDTFACNTSPITVFAPFNTSYEYKWLNLPGSSTNSYTISTKGKNKLYCEVTDISNAYGCKTSDTIIVRIANLSKPNLGPDKVSCSSFESIGLTANDTLSYRWNTGETTPKVEKSTAGTYILTVTEVNTTCTFSDTMKLSFIPSPPLDLGPDIRTCNKAPIVLKANPGWTTYAWDNGFNISTITVGTSNSYKVTTTNSCGSKSDTITITYVDTVLGFSLPADMFVCNPVTLTVPTQTDPNNKTLWSTEEVSSSITVNKSGVYWVSISNECGAKSDAIKIQFDTTPTPDFREQIAGTFIAFVNKSLNGSTYAWDFGDDSVSTEKNPSHRYLKKGTYNVKLTVTNSCGEVVSITKSISLYNSGVSNNIIEEISVFPNPSSDKFTIQLSENKKMEYTIELMTIEGRKIKSKVLKPTFNNQLELDVNEVSAGSYILRLIDKDNNQIIKNVTISK